MQQPQHPPRAPSPRQLHSRPPTQQLQQQQPQSVQPPHHHQQQQQQQGNSYVGVLHQPKPGDKVHFCLCCQNPIAIYGRLHPCMHAFCLTCATDMPKCYICLADINRLERVTYPLYISAATLQSFPTEDRLATHTKQMHMVLMNHPQFAAGMQQQQQQQPMGRSAAPAWAAQGAMRGAPAAQQSAG